MSFMDFFRAGGKRPAPPSHEAMEIQNALRDSGSVFLFGKSEAGENVNERTALQVATVYACVRILAETVASLPLHLYYDDNNGVKEKAMDHSLYNLLLNEPNPEMTSFSFWEALMTHLLLWGNAYAQIVRSGKNNILGLYPLLPEYMTVERADNGEIQYTYSSNTDEVSTVGNETIIFRRDQILHIPGLSFNGLVGFSPIAMMKNAIGSSIAVEKYGSKFFEHGAQPMGVLEHPTVIKDPAKIRENFMDTYGGVQNQFKVAVLEEGMTYKPISLPPEDSQFLSTKEFSVEEICRIFRVPPHLVQDLKRSTYNNIEHQGINFVQYTLRPWLTRIEKAIVKDVLYGDEKLEYYPKFNVEGLLRGDFASRMEGYTKLLSNGIMTVNEIRAKEDLPPISEEEGGNTHIVPGSMIPLKDVGAAYIPPKESDSNSSSSSSESTPNEGQEENSEEEQITESKAHKERHEERKKQRR